MIPRWRWILLLLMGMLGIGATAAALWHHRRPEQRFARALANLDAKQFDALRRELAALEEASGYEPQRHFLKGALLLEEGRPLEALGEFGCAREVPGLQVRTWILSGRALYQVHRYADAIALLKQAVQADPNAVEGHRWLAAASYDLGLIDQTSQHLARIAELDLSDPRPHRLLGLIQRDFENYRGAVESYRESLRRDPAQPDRDSIRLELAESHLKLLEHEAALAVLADAAPSPDRWVAEAECHHRAGRADTALGLLDQALRQTPAHLPGLLLQGTILLEQGNAGPAAEVFRKAVAAYPKDYTVRSKLIAAYRRLGDLEKVREQLPIAEQLKQLRLEFSKLHSTAASEPENAAVRCRLGVLARQLDRPDLARVWFQAALAIDPRHPETLRQLAGRAEPAPPP